MKSVFVLDDHPLVAIGLGLALRQARNLHLAGSASEPDLGLVEVEQAPPDALVLDLVFKGVLRLSYIQRFRAAAPDAAIVVFSSLLPARQWTRAVTEAGADAYLPKEADLSALVALISQLLLQQALGKLTRPRNAQPAADDEKGDDLLLFDGVHLTPREGAVARRLARGASIAMIARELNVSASTAAVHRDNVRKKLDCRDTTELVARLARLNTR